MRTGEERREVAERPRDYAKSRNFRPFETFSVRLDMILLGGNGRDRPDGYVFEHPADPIDPTCGSRLDWEEGMKPRKVTARIGFSVNGGHVATISPGRKAVPRVAGALAERAALKRNRSDDIPARSRTWPAILRTT